MHFGNVNLNFFFKYKSSICKPVRNGRSVQLLIFQHPNAFKNIYETTNVFIFIPLNLLRFVSISTDVYYYL